MRDAAQHAPYKGTISLLRHPGMEMVREEEELKSDLFCPLGVPNQHMGVVLFTG
jgi:hypothetical protein